MNQSIFTVFKPSLGPSSSHTTGPMAAAESFVRKQLEANRISQIKSLKIILYGSLAATGLGHCTDKALLYGLNGFTAETITSRIIHKLEKNYKLEKKIKLAGQEEIPFNLKKDLLFKPSINLIFHPNSLEFVAFNAVDQRIFSEVYYSIGGGIILSEHEIDKKSEEVIEKIPYPFSSFSDIYKQGEKKNISIAEMALANEDFFRTSEETFKKIDNVIEVMEDCIARGSARSGFLPGILKVRRRSFRLLKKLTEEANENQDPLRILDWVNLYALAVNEENASGSKVITAPTNGAAGIIPAVFSYYKKHTPDPSKKGIYDFFLTAGLIGLLYMKKSSISGAEVGCQGEVGVACSMAAAGLTAALGGNNRQIEKAAEIGMEHNLGLTCDPIAGLVQIPCIERNAMASIKAINASRIALMCHRKSFVSLDQVIETMRQTGLDMQNKYKETSTGGLAVNVTNC